MMYDALKDTDESQADRTLESIGLLLERLASTRNIPDLPTIINLTSEYRKLLTIVKSNFVWDKTKYGDPWAYEAMASNEQTTRRLQRGDDEETS